MRTSHRYGIALAVVAWAGCTLSPGPVDPTAGVAQPVAVTILQGSAFDVAGAREDASRLIAEATGLPVRLIAEEPAMERVTQPVAARLDRSVAAAARSDARDVACRKKARSIVTAVAEHATMIVRVRLDARTTARAASEAERAALGRKSGAAGVFTALGLGVGNTVHETTLHGTIERTTFPGQTATVRQKVRAVDRQLAGRDDTPPPRLRDALAPALAAMPAPRSNRWDTVARALVTGGCPVLGTAVADVFLDDVASKRRIRAAALGVLQSASTKSEDPSAPEPETTATDVEPSPPSEESAEVAASQAEPTCAALCSLQMVQLCNNDRALWSQHGSRWQNTRCGTRRNEAFLADCYRMQRLSGTYDRACVRPCEDTADGRSRLVSMLRRSGCLRDSG